MKTRNCLNDFEYDCDNCDVMDCQFAEHQEKFKKLKTRDDDDRPKRKER